MQKCRLGPDARSMDCTEFDFAQEAFDFESEFDIMYVCAYVCMYAVCMYACMYVCVLFLKIRFGIT